MISRQTFVVLFLIALIGCKERFEPNLPSLDKRYLIVEGFINSGNGPTQIKLSRSSPIDTAKNFRPELNAIVQVEGEDNSTQLLSAMSNGLYSAGTLSLKNNIKYRVRIKTKEGKEYLSEFVRVKTTPPIDSVSWKEENGGITVYVDTHDPQNETRYYRWEYDETWEIRSHYDAAFRYVNGVVRPRLPNDPETNICWKYGQSNSILIGSSAKLASDVIHLSPIVSVPYRDERTGWRYSVLVRQYAIDKEEYEFLSQMKKNTESLGTIFDPQPSALSGNIRCVTDTKEMVIGYINATSEVEKRFFVRSDEISGPRFSMGCRSDTIKIGDILKYVPSVLPHTSVLDDMGIPYAYLVSVPPCVDCRTRGSNIKPTYW